MDQNSSKFYCFRNILRDYPDGKARVILKSLIGAMRKESLI